MTLEELTRLIDARHPGQDGPPQAYFEDEGGNHRPYITIVNGSPRPEGAPRSGKKTHEAAIASFWENWQETFEAGVPLVWRLPPYVANVGSGGVMVRARCAVGRLKPTPDGSA